MTRLRVKRSPQESQPVQHRVHLAKRAAALDWPRLKDETIFFSELLERKRDRGAPRKRYKDQLKRQLAQPCLCEPSVLAARGLKPRQLALISEKSQS